MSALLWFHLQEVLPVEGDAALSHFVGRVSHDDIAECAFASTVSAHESVDLAVAYGEVYALKYFFAIDAGMEILDF
jgi:hypothetical protein